MTVEQAVEQCIIIQQAGASVKKQAISCGTLKRYKKNELIFREREEVQRLYCVISGYVALFRTNCHCDRKIIFICGKGELINEATLENPVSSVSALVFEEAIVLSFSRNQFFEMMKSDFLFTKAILDSNAKKIRRLYHQIANTPNMFLLERQLASKLWKLARDFGIETEEGIWIAFEIPVAFLADMVGSKRESVSRAIKVLRDKGAIKVKSNRFLIPNMDRLQEIVYEKNKKV